ncbi:hypothetical protein K2X85_03005 [bacterium]|nr:hypothetical protein [bacterium]
MADYSPYQKKIIKRYYDQASNIGLTRLQELTTEIFLAEGKKKDRLWKQVAGTLAKLELPPSRIEHILAKQDPQLLAEVVKELC